MQHNTSCQQQPLTAQATVTEITQHGATIAISSREKKSCQQCENKSGCQSVSIYHLLFSKRPISITNNQYHIGQKLTIKFPNSLILKSVGLLLGLPLTGFILGAVLGGMHHEITGFIVGIIAALLAYRVGQQLLQKQLVPNIIITE